MPLNPTRVHQDSQPTFPPKPAAKLQRLTRVFSHGFALRSLCQSWTAMSRWLRAAGARKSMGTKIRRGLPRAAQWAWRAVRHVHRQAACCRRTGSSRCLGDFCGRLRETRRSVLVAWKLEVIRAGMCRGRAFCPRASLASRNMLPQQKLLQLLPLSQARRYLSGGDPAQAPFTDSPRCRTGEQVQAHGKRATGGNVHPSISTRPPRSQCWPGSQPFRTPCSSAPAPATSPSKQCFPSFFLVQPVPQANSACCSRLRSTHIKNKCLLHGFRTGSVLEAVAPGVQLKQSHDNEVLRGSTTAPRRQPRKQSPFKVFSYCHLCLRRWGCTPGAIV